MILTKHAKRRWKRRRWAPIDDLLLVANGAWHRGEEIPASEPGKTVKRYLGMDFIFALKAGEPVLVTVYSAKYRGYKR